MEDKKLALSAPADKNQGSAVDFSGLPERFSGKPDSIPVDVCTFTFRKVCKIKRWDDKTSKEVFKVWVKGDAAEWVLQQEALKKDSEKRNLDEWFLQMNSKFSRRFTEKKQKITSIRPLVNLVPKKNEEVNEFNYRFMEILDLIIPDIIHPATVKSIYLEAIIAIDSELSWILSNEADCNKWRVEDLLREANTMYLKRKKYSLESGKNNIIIPTKEKKDNTIEELTKQLSRIALLLEERKKKESAPVKCYSCNSFGHISTNCPNRNIPYRDRNYQKNNYPNKDYVSSGNSRDLENDSKENKDVLLFEKINNEDLLVAQKRVRIDDLIDHSDSDARMIIQGKNNSKKKLLSGKAKKQKKSAGKVKTKKVSDWSKKFFESPVPLSIEDYLRGKPKAIDELIMSLRELKKK
ncbi:hypothetical protein AYI69_g1578 [Smittium culicis]|uniref:CCHC-type domain-containing protein n=1 Tax=Smittium culicis TaxID=133412 RepID=A0A1R1YPY0_9FUNG|nr:hypothetical protein AYI69_g1578 [Smittium culicis]